MTSPRSEQADSARSQHQARSEPAEHLRVLGGFIRAQRKLANLSLRQLSELTEVSNPYLSQVERGLHEPSVRVLKSIAAALNVSAQTLFEHSGPIERSTPPARAADRATETAIRVDPRLSVQQRRALLSVYRSYLEANG